MLKASAVRSRHLAPGDPLGKYEVIRQIAIGGMAELYLARTTGIEGFEKLVVLKRILPQYVSNSSFVNMFLNEARLAATLHHPNVAQVYDIGVEDGDYFFSMEYVHGEDLDHMAIAADEQGVPISMDAALTLVAGLCAGLHYAHERVSAEGKPLGIVHRDVSPSNVLVSYDGAVKVVDFGIARASSRPGTTQGGLKGKIAYMSPEQCREKATLDRRSDIYSIGAILYQLTTGRLPFTGQTEYQILNQIVNDDVPPPSSLVPSYPPALERIVLHALARDPDKRFRTAIELQSAVEDFAHDTRLRVSPLVLARLMGTLFPARLEEWDHAKAQGAFFVEQHVVRTLIESGKTPDRSDPATKARVAAAAITDDERTHVNQPLTDLEGDTAIGEVPIATSSSGQTDVHTIPAIPRHVTPPTAVPAAPRVAAPMPQAYPVLASGVMVSSSTPGGPQAPAHRVMPTMVLGAPQPVAGQADVTERVRAPTRRAPSPTSFVRASSARRTALFGLAAAVAVGAGIAVFIITRDTQSPASAPAQTVDVASPPKADTDKAAVETAPAAANPTVPPAAEPTPTAPALATPEPTVPTVPEPTVPTVPEPAADDPDATVAAKKSAPAKTATVAKRAKAKAEPKVEKKVEPKEAKTWNADSPFMPVRTK